MDTSCLPLLFFDLWACSSLHSFFSGANRGHAISSCNQEIRTATSSRPLPPLALATVVVHVPET